MGEEKKLCSCVRAFQLQSTVRGRFGGQMTGLPRSLGKEYDVNTKKNKSPSGAEVIECFLQATSKLRATAVRSCGQGLENWLLPFELEARNKTKIKQGAIFRGGCCFYFADDARKPFRMLNILCFNKV
ncbi:hypothetical protein NC652_030988 [Populus alba x Populus x berolinensis]|nr:hypothetical protein NC652_030988 [Populus alba x Populus x berolinensis]